MTWVLCGVESPLDSPQIPQRTMPLLKVLGCLLLMMMILGFGGLGIFLRIILAVGGESVQWSCSEEQPGTWERRESWQEGYFILRGLLGGLKRGLLGWVCGDFSDGGDWGAGCGDCTWGCCGVVSDDDLWVSVGVLACIQSFLALISPLSLHLFRFVEVSISSGCSPSLFFFLVILLDFLTGDGGCHGVWDRGCADVAGSVGFSVSTAVVVSVVFSDVVGFTIASTAGFLSGAFSLFWSPGSTLLPVCFGDSQISE